MPFLLLFLGVVFVVSGVRGTQGDLLMLLKGDFTGKNNFIYWILALYAIGATGYVEALRPISDAFMVLILVVMILSNKGFFDNFMKQIEPTTT